MISPQKLVELKAKLMRKKEENSKLGGKIEQLESEMIEKYGGSDDKIRKEMEKRLVALKEEYKAKSDEFETRYHTILSDLEDE